MAKSALRTKLRRDMWRSMMQFLSIVMLCSLGTFMFAGLDGCYRLAQGTIDIYFDNNNLADFWITTTCADRDTLGRIRAVEGVRQVCARASMDMETTLPGEPMLNVTAYDGPMEINAPIVEEGMPLDETDLRGCLIQEGFARTHGLTVGDRVEVKTGVLNYSFIIRGIIFSPEFIYVTQGVYPDPKTYGYILVNARAVPELPLMEVLVTLTPDIDKAQVKGAIEAALPTALVLDRSAHQSTANAQSNADMFSNLQLVFPMMAYAVAALIVMTTLTRMIDNQRMQMGTLKALGYPARRIRGHYLSYALLPSLLGSVLGVLAGHAVLPSAVWALLLGQNEYPYQIYPHISVYSWAMVALTVLMSTGICLHTYRKSARETAADLLRPKPPRAGRRIFLERITPLWKRFDFNTKMIARNLLRNRMRTIMSFVGVLCCNALIIASFGLQDSVSALAENHYTKTLHYDVRASLTTDADSAESYMARLDAERVECILEKAVSVRSDTTGRTSLLTVVQQGQQLLYLGENETLMDILPGGVAVTEKLAQMLKVGVGDTLLVYFPGDDEPIAVSVVQLAYNSVSQGLYMLRDTWESLRKGAFEPTALLIGKPSATCLKQLESMEEVDKLERPMDQSNELIRMLDMLSNIFVMITFIALALAFVVCYNMGLMNFAERTREYATLKVLGYHQKEIRRLIIGENNIISILGVALGVAPGLLLTSVVLRVCESETLRYPAHTAVSSVLLACAITLVFSLLIQLLLTRKVRSIDMVEALKSVE